MDVNCLFKGGGAKGVAYLGALRALNECDLDVRSVAGTSAGAITAAIVAARVPLDRIELEVPALLASLRRRPLRLAMGRSDAVFSTEQLGLRLESLLTSVVPTSAPRLTFGELYEATRVLLYVVALDLTSRQPIVFSAVTTPEVSVTDAVLASSAIPGIFPAARALLRRGGAGPTFGRVVDGGAWANYPRFVYFDASFTQWLKDQNPDFELHDRHRVTIGFALGQPQASPVVGDQLIVNRHDFSDMDSGVLMSSGNPLSWTVGQLLGSAVARLALGAALVFSLLSLLKLFTRAASDLWTNSLGSWAAGGAGPALALLVCMAALITGTIVTLVLLVLILGGGALAGSVLPAAQAALSVGTGMAAWYGADEREPIIHLPYYPLTTTAFHDPLERVTGVIERAEVVAGRELASMGFGEAPPPTELVSSSPTPETEPHSTVQRLFVEGTLLLATGVVVLLLAVGSLITGWSAVGLVLWIFGFACLVMVAVVLAERHHLVAAGQMHLQPLATRLAVALCCTAGVVLIGLGAQSADTRIERRSASTDLVTVTSTAIAPDGVDDDFEMTFTGGSGDSSGWRFTSSRAYVPGDRVVLDPIENDDGSIAFYIEDPAQPANFYFPVAAQIVGIAALFVAYSLQRTSRRQRFIQEVAKRGSGS